MDQATIDHVLFDNKVDPVSGIPFSAIIFMLYYGMELNHFLLDISNDFIKQLPLKQYHVGTSSTYLSGSAVEGLYLNTKRITDARDIDIVTIWRKYPIREKCHYEDFSVEEWLLKSRSGQREECTCVSDVRLNVTAKECDDRYLNIKVLPETPPGYVLLQKCRRPPAPVLSLDDILVSSLKTTEARMDYWNDIRDNLKQRFKPGDHYVDEDGMHEEGPLFDFISSHGPAVTATMAGPGLFGSCILFEGIDMVFAVPYPLPWPDIAKEWVTRKRPSGWPSQKLVNDVVADGCTLVPKGSTGSALEDYEWRISFTGELRLARSLSLVQRQILHILKALVSEQQHDLEMKAIGIDLTAKIESFQFLNLIFRECEILDEHEWDSKNIAQMLFHVIDTYLEHFEQGHLSHYLIKTRNILEKFRDISAEERETLLYTLYRIRKNPLGQILQQKRYLRLKSETHKQVFAPFVEEVKTKGVSQKLYVNTLVALVKAHLLENSYSSGNIYAMDALQFYQRMTDHDMSDQEYMDLVFTIAISCHRLGQPEKVLEFLEKLHIVMSGRSKESVSNTFGVRNHAELLVLFARTLLVFAKKETQFAETNTAVQHAMDLYTDALKLDPYNVLIQIDQMNMQMHFGDTLATENLVLSVMSRFTESGNVASQYTDSNQPSDLQDTELNDVEVIYDREGFVNDELNKNVYATDTSQFDYLFGYSRSVFDEEPPGVYVPTVDRDNDINEEEPEIVTVDREENLPYKVAGDSDETHLHNENSPTDENLWKIGGPFMRDFYQMKAFKEINMKHEVEIIKNRIEKRMLEKRQEGINVYFPMLESLYELYESMLVKKADCDSDRLLVDVISDNHNHVIYSTADILLLDDSLVNLFPLFDSTVIRIPDKVLALHLYMQFCQRQGKTDEAKVALQEMEDNVQSLRHVFDFAIGKSILSAHYKSLGEEDLGNEYHASAKEIVLNSKDNVDPPSVKHQIVKWINDVFSTVALNEPYNKYLDNIF